MLIKQKATKEEFDELVRRHECLCDLVKESNDKIVELEERHQALKPVFEALVARVDLMYDEDIERRRGIVNALDDILRKSKARNG